MVLECELEGSFLVHLSCSLCGQKQTHIYNMGIMLVTYFTELF